MTGDDWFKLRIKKINFDKRISDLQLLEVALIG
jgi:hypothetical protein